MGTFQVAAPDLVARGFFGIVAPPYYEVSPVRKRSVNAYVREQSDLVQWKALNLYARELEIEITYQGQLTKKLDQEQIVLLAMKAFEVGRAIENLSNELSLPGLLIEAMTYVTYFLTPETMDVRAIQEILVGYRVEYNPAINTLILSIGREDYMIPLYNVQMRITEEVSALLHRIEWRTWTIGVKPKKKFGSCDPVSIYQLYELFQDLDRMISVKVLKGIGSMDGKEAAMTCMNPRNRRVYDITALGDIDVIYDLLGRDSTPRKHLYQAPTLSELSRL